MGHGFFIRAAGRVLAGIFDAGGDPGTAAAIRGGALAASAVVDPVGTTISVALGKVLHGNDSEAPDVPIDI